jgi:hypothetical protein
LRHAASLAPGKYGQELGNLREGARSYNDAKTGGLPCEPHRRDTCREWNHDHPAGTVRTSTDVLAKHVTRATKNLPSIAIAPVVRSGTDLLEES